MKAQQSTPAEQPRAVEADAFCLSQLEVYNWGPFCGLHRIDIDPAGCALIGQTGSGKTTLVDAIMTLICAQPKYNLASTGGHESDRDLISYVRGVTGSGGDDESAHIARPGQTVTGLSAEFSLGESRLQLSTLLWLDSTSTSQSDMKRLWIFDKSAHQNLSDYLLQHKELGSRGLKLQLKEHDGLLATDNKKTYLAQVRRFFEVGEKAFVLLNRAAGLKQLNSINDLFRELVLDDRSAFDRAAEVANEFDELQGIHGELEIARNQQQSLLPIADMHKQQHSASQKLTLLSEQQNLLPQWFAHHGYRLWSQQASQKQAVIERAQAAIRQLRQQQQQQQGMVDECYQRYQKLGGANIEDLKRQIEDQQKQLAHLQQNVRDYHQLCQALDLKPDLKRAQLLSNQQLAEDRLEGLKKELNDLDSLREQQSQKTLNAEDQLKQLEQEIAEVKAMPDSNIPVDYRRFQQALADELKISAEQLPYIGQCVEVQDRDWQGAIERAIGSHRLRLVVDADHMPATLDWVNRRNNRLHVRLLNTADYQKVSRTMDDGFCHKLKFKQGTLQSLVKNFLASIDRHCVGSAEALRDTPYDLTREGMMSGKRGLFEKQDQRSLEQGWMTGFDNHNRLAELNQQQHERRQQAQHLRQQLEATKDKQVKGQQQQSLLSNVQNIDFENLDVSGAKKRATQLQRRLAELQNPESDTAKAEQQWQSANTELAEIQRQINEQNVQFELAQKEQLSATKQAEKSRLRFSEPLTEEQLKQLATVYETPEVDQLEELASLERDAMQSLQQKTTRQQKRLAELEGKLGRLMVSAKQKDTGALSEAGTELEDIPAYLQRLDLLSKEALPAKLERFLHYLNQSSDQGVTQLLTRIENEVSVIEERIDELNATMREVDFQPDRFLQLMPQKVSHEALHSLQKAQRDLRSAAMQDDQGEAHYKALVVLIQQLRNAVERKRTRPAQALLDPRYRLQFSVAIIERDSGRVIENRTGSQGGSGGEKEIIASFILTASLSYALCPQDRKTPLFGTVILDEAFSKSSQAVAARIISALRQFGLHPLFVTPNKEMRLLRIHTSAAVLVHRRTQQSFALSLSWEEIDQHLLQRTESSKGVTPDS